MRKRRLVSALAVVVVVLAGGIAYAAAGGDGGVVNACAKTQGGQLRLDTGDGCLPSEHALQWNQTGPQGPPGIAHADERYFYRGATNPENWLAIVNGTWPDIQPSMTRVLTMHLDRGSYVVTAEVIGHNGQGQGVLLCLLGTPTLGYALAQSSLGAAPGYSIEQTMEAQTIFSLGEATDLPLSCFNAPTALGPGSGNPSVGYADVIATRIDTFTSTQQP